MNSHLPGRLISLLVIALAVAMITPVCHAQLLGQVSTARTIERGANDVGGYLGLFEDFTTVFGQYRHGVSNSFDFGLQGGIIDPDVRGADAGLIIGGDMKWMVMSAGADPFDMALDGRVSLYDISNVTVFSVGGLVLMSRDYKLSQGSILSPYGGVNIRVEHASYDTGPFDEPGLRSARTAADFNDSDTELNIGGVVGTKWEMSDLIDALGEIILDDQLGIVLGLNFKL